MNLRFLTISLCTLIATLAMHSGSLIRYTDHSNQKVSAAISGPRTQLADNYFYFTLLRHAPERLLDSQNNSLDPDYSDHRHINSISSSYASALYAGYFIYKASTFFTTNARDALLLTALFHTWLFVATMVIFVLTLLNTKNPHTPIKVLFLAVLSLIGIDSFSLSTYYGFPYWDKSLLLNEPNVVRFINPTLFWTAGLLASTYIVRWLREDRMVDLAIGAAFTLICCLFSISVGAVLVGAIGITVLANIYRVREVPWRFLILLATGSIGLAWTYIQIVEYANSSLGQMLRHGAFNEWILKWQFMLFLVFVPFLKRYLKADGVFLISLLLCSIVIGALCDSFNLGARLWLRGGAIFVWAISLFFLLKMLDLVSWYLNPRITHFVTFFITIYFLVYVVSSQYPRSNSWIGFIESEKSELYDWIERNITPNSIIASRDSEDAFLIPVYTNSKSVFSSYGITQRTLDEEMRRFFYVMGIYDVDRSAVKAILEIDKEDVANYYKHIFSDASPRRYVGQKADAVIFWRNIIYAPYIERFANVLVGESRHIEFTSLINKRAIEGVSTKFHFHYAILNFDEPRPNYFSDWKIVYSNSKYGLLVKPE